MRQTIGPEELLALPLPFPPRPEQTAIAAFLDRETGKIDALVEEQKRLIELLKEKRQIVISHAVTKGLDPNVPMKPAGVEWLGDVPEHWQVRSVGSISSVVRGASPRPAGDPRYFDGNDVPWVTVAEITRDEEEELWTTDSFLTKAGAEQSRIIPADTLIYSNSGATLGVPRILKVPACANDGVVALQDLSDSVNIRFLFYFLKSITSAIRDKIRQGSGQPNLNTDIVRRIQFAMPPLAEQEAILSSLDASASRHRALEQEAATAVGLLIERRSALIFAAVTGQINVRNYKV